MPTKRPAPKRETEPEPPQFAPIRYGDVRSQATKALSFQVGATADGNGAMQRLDGYSGPVVVEIQSPDTATGTATIEGSLDGVRWFGVRYYQQDAVAAGTPVVAAITVTAGLDHVYRVLDYWEYLRVRLSGVAGGGSGINASGLAVPQT